MAKIAVELDRALALREMNGAPGAATARRVAQGEGWTVSDVVCTSGPRDRPFEERHTDVSISIVGAGSFQYRSASGRELMTPGSLLLGNAGQAFECAHDHGTGDRCLSFGYAPDAFERLAADVGVRPGFRVGRVPPVRALSPLVARAFSGVAGGVAAFDPGRSGFAAAAFGNGRSGFAAAASWEELSLQLAARTLRLAAGLSAPSPDASPAAVSRVARTVRRIEREPGEDLALGSLAREAGLSPYHFLRTFQSLTGVTPYQYVVRTRLRAAALRLTAEPARVIDIALDSGFGDVSNFNRAFRTEFGVSPRAYRTAALGERPR